MPGIQERMLEQQRQQNQHWMILLFLLLPKILMLLFRIIRHAIKYGWIFPVLGLLTARVFHHFTPDVHIVLHIFFYIALTAIGIPPMIWKLEANKKKQMKH